MPEEAPKEVAELIDLCIQEEPSKRPSAKDLLEFFTAGLARLDAEAGVRGGLASAASIGGGSVGETLARVSRANSAGGGGGDDDAFALPPGSARGSGGGEAQQQQQPLKRTSAAPREPPVPEEEKEGEEEEEEEGEQSAAAGAAR